MVTILIASSIFHAGTCDLMLATMQEKNILASCSILVVMPMPFCLMQPGPLPTVAVSPTLATARVRPDNVLKQKLCQPSHIRLQCMSISPLFLGPLLFFVYRPWYCLLLQGSGHLCPQGGMDK